MLIDKLHIRVLIHHIVFAIGINVDVIAPDAKQLFCNKTAPAEKKHDCQGNDKRGRKNRQNSHDVKEFFPRYGSTVDGKGIDITHDGGHQANKEAEFYAVPESLEEVSFLKNIENIGKVYLAVFVCDAGYEKPDNRINAEKNQDGENKENSQK